jgi:hypothetical protein
MLFMNAVKFITVVKILILGTLYARTNRSHWTYVPVKTVP